MKRLFLGLYIGLVTGGALFSVGQIPECSKDPYGWQLVLTVFLMMAAPAYMGWSIGKETPND